MATIVHTHSTPIDTGFQAKWPTHLDPALESTCTKVGRVFWNVISVIIFPIGLCRLAFWLVRKVALGYAVPGPFHVDKLNGKCLLEKMGGQNIQMKSPDGVKLDGAIFPGKEQKKAVIFSFGNAMSWETSSYYISLLKMLGVTVLVLNPRGIGKSEGSRSEKGFALDIYTGYEYLIEKKGIKPSDIVHVGYSMGGGYGAEGAALVQKKYPQENLSAMNIRSFSSLHTEANALLGKTGCYLGCLGKLGLWMAGLNMNPKAALDTLKGRICIVSSPSDGVIPKEASMIKEMKEKSSRPITHIQLRGGPLPNIQDHNRNFFLDEGIAIRNELNTMLGIESRFVHEEITTPSSTPLKIETVG